MTDTCLETDSIVLDPSSVVRAEDCNDEEFKDATAVIVQEANASLSLCAACQKCLVRVCNPTDLDGMGWMNRLKWPDIPAQYRAPLHDSYQSWDNAVDGGCWICCQLREYIPASVLDGWATNKTIGGGPVMYSAKVFDGKPFSLSITTGGYGMGFAVRWLPNSGMQIEGDDTTREICC